MSFLDDLRNLDRNNIGGWSPGVKAFFAILIVVVILFFGWWFKIRAQQEELETARSQELTLKREFATDQAKVVNLEPYRKQLADMQEMLQTMLRQLPSKTEMPELLNNITQAALSAGIETELFQPGAELMKDFYAEKPIQLRMLGTYHQFGTFISNVASLPRVVILTMHDVSLKPASAADAKKGGAAGLLMLEGTVKTYRYLDDEEAAAVQATKNPQKGKKPPPAKPAKGGA
ncbi:type 4a pilus biogenesis protein PilO [Dokdonella sp.]|uniref:type 4a pilus biogenesis protein PilO n=1 Tax=Dokdonella sp. TaxID=2291710 RepID=UPI0025C26329|nr:type 4a pilus biogenesis protein PilO [Dokdonella sp.]MBX3688633.1 type 4a pilus biogenesis protein PilO [Dokdonella sp.]